MSLESIPAYTSFRSGVVGLAYNEAAFRHFLRIEHARAERASRAVVLVLVSAHSGSEKRPMLSSAAAAGLFARLGESVREVDFVGWYREGRVAGAVLTQHSSAPDDFCVRIANRVRNAIGSRATPESAPLRVRVICLGKKKTGH